MYGGKQYWQQSKIYDFKKLSQNPTFKKEISGIYEIWHWEDEAGRPHLRVYKGKSGKPFVNYYYIHESTFFKELDSYRKNGRKIAEYKAEQKRQNKGQPSAHALAAKMIREELKKTFPNVKFKVRSESYTGGNSVDVDWVDGPPTEQVEKIIDKYQGGYFDGMQDLYIYTGNNSVITNDGEIVELPSVKYVFANRHMSEEIKKKLTEEICAKYDVPIDNPQKQWAKLGCYLDQFVWREFYKMDLTKQENHV